LTNGIEDFVLTLTRLKVACFLLNVAPDASQEQVKLQNRLQY
jgi:hypothetical protein